MTLTLVTPRLILRRPLPQDVPAAVAFWASERSYMMGGPWTAAQTEAETQDLFSQWDKHGFSLFTVTLRGSDQGIGGIGPFFPDTHPEPELGWSLWDAKFEGQGLAFEAAVAARDWFFATSGYRTAVSYTDPLNLRSHRLCERLGAVIDLTAPHPYGDLPTLTYRHHLRNEVLE
jgi:RimJ/RimL family protein N-acetyltransferase